MSLLVSHMSALDFWRLVYPSGKAPETSRCVAPTAHGIAKEEDVWATAPSLFTREVLSPEGGILHVTVSDEGARRKSRTCSSHIWSGNLPAASFYQLADGAFIASPQFTFLQLAKTLTLIQLIVLGHELCGLYSFDYREEFGMKQRETPLITLRQLRDFLDQAAVSCAFGGSGKKQAPHGMQKAQRALRYIVERSASPAETAVAMLLTLPYRLGGYGMSQPAMNQPIVLTGNAAHIAKRRTLKADLLWQDQQLVLEYNGTGPHSDAASVLSDRARTSALQLMGFDVHEITSEQLFDCAAFEPIALHLAKLLRKRIPSNARGSSDARMRLRREVFSWNRAMGRAALAPELRP